MSKSPKSELLVSCPGCGTPNFTPKGLRAHKCDGKNRDSASDPALADVMELPETAMTRVTRIRAWHQHASGAAWRLKLLVFFAGMEIQGLKAELGVSAGRPEKFGNGFRINGKTYATWEEIVVSECGLTSRTARNYATAYANMCEAAPAVVNQIMAAAGPQLANCEQLTLPDPDAAIAAVAEEDLIAFRDALDPWSLSELYQKPMSAVQAQIAEETAKKDSQTSEKQAMLQFWFEDFDGRLKSKSHLKLPKKQREMLLNTMEITVKELRDSLRSK